jgi:hypothetical protein
MDGRSMWRLLASQQWRERLVYAAMSLLLVWHTIAIVVASAPDSLMTRSVRPLLHPYVTLFRLDNHWGFFSPNVAARHTRPRGSQASARAQIQTTSLVSRCRSLQALAAHSDANFGFAALKLVMVRPSPAGNLSDFVRRAFAYLSAHAR